MEESRNRHEASASATGYLFQCRYALLAGLLAIPDTAFDFNREVRRRSLRGSKSLQPGFWRGPPRQGGGGIRQEVATAISLCPRVSRFSYRASSGDAVGSPGIDDYVTLPWIQGNREQLVNFALHVQSLRSITLRSCSERRMKRSP